MVYQYCILNLFLNPNFISRPYSGMGEESNLSKIKPSQKMLFPSFSFLYLNHLGFWLMNVDIWKPRLPDSLNITCDSKLCTVGLDQCKYLGIRERKNWNSLRTENYGQASIGRLEEWKNMFSFSGIYTSSPRVKGSFGSKVLPPTLMEK